ncbi:MOSC domain-containing protein [Lentzea cavernae]|uniref:Molybdenum cofactor sulfurase n=1 Tax=Lentzea cavernae TaxID=2020703 RepID=A0ABQ3LW11_9PSEU|nr:MOSC domain-containing protein [Lentzea cavernae]GHH27730.1 molybdenum cofactor sulfurase [Lentzea cavernae]
MPGTAKNLFTYPIKGLTAHPLDQVILHPNRGFPHDRTLALARPNGRYQPGTRTALPKQEFYALVSDPRLSGIITHYNPDTEILTAEVAGHQVLNTDLSTTEGTDEATRFFTRVLDLPPDQNPVLAREPNRRFTDANAAGDGPMNWVSLINLASLRDLEARTGTTIDPQRFRANIFVDGLPAWSEVDLLNQKFTLGGIQVKAVHQTKRCAATEVNPATGRRDLPVVTLLQRTYGHQFMGFYVEVLTTGTLHKGGEVVV